MPIKQWNCLENKMAIIQWKYLEMKYLLNSEKIK